MDWGWFRRFMSLIFAGIGGITGILLAGATILDVRVHHLLFALLLMWGALISGYELARWDNRIDH